MADDIKYATYNGKQYRVAKNGVLIDPETNRFVPGGKVSTAITTSEQGRDMAKRRAEKRREVVLQAANNAVERADLRHTHKDYAYIAAIVETAMIKATTADDPKAIEAARFVMKQAGDLEEAEEGDAGKNESVLAALGREALEHLLNKQREARANE